MMAEQDKSGAKGAFSKDFIGADSTDQTASREKDSPAAEPEQGQARPSIPKCVPRWMVY